MSPNHRLGAPKIPAPVAVRLCHSLPIFLSLCGLLISIVVMYGCVDGSTRASSTIVYDPKSGAQGQTPRKMSLTEARQLIESHFHSTTITTTTNGQTTVLEFVIDSQQLGSKQNPDFSYVYGSLLGPVVDITRVTTTTTKPNGEKQVREHDGYVVKHDSQSKGNWFICDTREDGVALVDAILSIETYFTTDHTAEIADQLQRFAPIVDNYHAQNPRPEIPEETRKFKVQAEAASSERQYDAAIQFYQKGLEASPWWPEGHLNMALLLEQQEFLPAAYTELKKYLALVPDAADARNARDKLYIWEAKLERMGKRTRSAQ
jgi:hypothetical protein